MSGDVLRRAVFLDRDGVVNEAVVVDGLPFPPPTPEAVVLTPFVAESLARLRAMGFLLVVVTNQPDVRRGMTMREAVEAIHCDMMRVLPIDRVCVCFHDSIDDCGCRKPRPGMLFDAAAELGIALAESYMIGDRRGDVEAGKSAGCTTIFIDRGYAEVRPAAQDHTSLSLPDAVDWIARREGAFQCKS